MAYARDGQRSDCITALVAADHAIEAGDDQTESVAYFQGPGLAASIRSDCLHQFGSGRDALTAAEEALQLLGGEFVRNRALTTLDRAHALTDLGEVHAAAAAIEDAAGLAVSCRSDRLTDRIRDARAGLDRWATTTPVLELDERLDDYGLSGSRT